MKKMIFLLIASISGGVASAQNDSIEKIKLQLLTEPVDSLKIELMINLGDKYMFIKNDSAAHYFQQAIALSVKTANIKQEIEANSSLANLMVHMHNFSEALRLSLQDLEKEKKEKDTIGIFYSQRDIMWAYRDLKNYDKVLEYARLLVSLLKSSAIKNYSGAEGFKEIAYRLIGNAYSELQQPDSALSYYTLSYSIAKKMKRPGFLALSASNLGDFFRNSKMPDSALYYFRIGLTNARQSGRFDIINEAHLDMAKIFLARSDPDSAFIYADSAFIRAKNVPDSSRMAAAAFLLSDIYKKKNKIDSAYKYIKYATQIKGILETEEDLRKTNELFFNETLHNQQLEQERKQAEEKYKSNIKIYSLFGGLSVLLLLSILFYRNSKRKQRDAAKIQESYDKLKSTQQQLVHAEKMASLGELTAGIAHEIQNPLNFVNNFSDVNTELIDEMEQEINKGNMNDVKALAKDIKENEQKINHHGKRADAIVKGMLQHSRSSSGVKEPTDINALADEYLRLSYHGLRAKDKSFNATMKTDFDESIVKLNIVPQDIGRVLLNLYNNAFYAVTEKAKQQPNGYEPLVSVSSKKISNKVELTVTDNGNGIPQKVIDKIFQPFFTTKPTGQGTGLGLSLSYDIIKAHGGEIKVETKEGEGTTFIIQLATT